MTSNLRVGVMKLKQVVTLLLSNVRRLSPALVIQTNHKGHASYKWDYSVNRTAVAFQLEPSTWPHSNEFELHDNESMNTMIKQCFHYICWTWDAFIPKLKISLIGNSLTVLQCYSVSVTVKSPESNVLVLGQNLCNVHVLNYFYDILKMYFCVFFKYDSFCSINPLHTETQIL